MLSTAAVKEESNESYNILFLAEEIESFIIAEFEDLSGCRRKSFSHWFS
jgi:hypothetical protein